jgi:hypothetical protein
MGCRRAADLHHHGVTSIGSVKSQTLSTASLDSFFFSGNAHSNREQRWCE